MTPFSSILDFCRLLNDLRNVERIVHANGQDRMENDVEHSYQLGMLAWYIASSSNLNLNRDLLLKYALVHDLQEVHAGDTYIFGPQEHLDSKADREKAAREKLREDWSDFPDLHELIDTYERKEDPESRFVYALDKVYPVINIYLNGGRTWNEAKVSLQMIIENKEQKVALSPEVKKYFDELVAILKENEKTLFVTE